MNEWVDWLCLAWCVGGYDELYILYSGTILRVWYTTSDLTTTAVDSKYFFWNSLFIDANLYMKHDDFWFKRK